MLNEYRFDCNNEKKEEFYANYKDDDKVKIFNGKKLIFYAIANHDLESRYEICNFLLDEGIDVTGVDSENQSIMHILLGQKKHDLEKTIKLVERFINAGVDINIIDKQNRVALQYIINMKFTDEELKPLYDLWFTQPYVEVLQKNNADMSPIDIASKLPYRKEILERMKSYVKTKED